MKRILFVVQLPPPIHGVAIINEIVVHSAGINENFITRNINISTSDEIEHIGRFSGKKIISVARHLFLLIKNLISFRPHLVYITLAPSGFAFYRDTVYIFFIKLFRKRLVIHLHGQGIKAGAEKSRLFKWLCKKIFNDSFVIFLSEKLRSDATVFVKKPSFIVNNGFPHFYTPTENKPVREGPVQLLYLSNYVRSKGILDLIDAIELVAQTHGNFHLSLVGKPFDISVPFLTQYIGEKKLADKITINGPKYKEEKIEVLENAEIFILPTYNEAFPLALLEAMGYALAIISTYEGGIPDIIDDGINGLLFKQRDIYALAEKIKFLLDHPEKRAEIGKAARKKFLDKYTISVFEKNILLTLQEISEADRS